ncbi:MAG TPA: response regulator [Paucimonas sp.]|nr:response regulator [Paucimonas sp.]
MKALSRSMFWKLFLPVCGVLIASALAAAVLLPSIIRDDAEREAVETAEETVRQFKMLRQYYTDNVVSKVRPLGVEVTAEHAANPKAVPLPASMIHDLSELFSASGTTLKLYSPYPFPNRKNRKMDRFGEDAWSYLQANPDKTFYRTELSGSRTVVRVAVADRMASQLCVACHNATTGSPKTDWKLGDVRGVLEVASSRQLATGERIIGEIMVALAAMLFALAVFLHYFYRHSIVRPLHVALDAAETLADATTERVRAIEAVAAGNLDRDLAVARPPRFDAQAISEDEIGRLLESVIRMNSLQTSLDEAFRKMTASLRHVRDAERLRDWVKTSLNDLNAIMRGEHDTSALADRILQYLAERLNAGVGAIYLYDVGSGYLQLTAGYALAGGRTVRGRFLLGEGLLGQAARDGKTVFIDEVPAEYLPIRSALGETAPGHLVALPLMHADTLIGALELGTLHPFTDEQREFLLHAREGIAICFDVNRARQRTQELLIQARQQAEELRVQQEELQQSNEELEERADLLERQREQIRAKNEEVEAASRELRAKAEELERANTYKSEFLANMSHELRTPLNSMLILSGLLKENKDGNLAPKQVEFAETIHGAGRDLLTLINDILDLSKVEAGHVDFHYGDAFPQEIMAPLENMFRPVAEQKGLALAIDADPGLPESLRVDLARTQQILKNLLSNALKFTARGEVRLRMWKPEGRDNPLPVPAVAFTVADTGIGIPRDKQGLIFDAFKQADGGVSRKYGGTGLGLSISRQLARQMGGDVTLASIEGSGSSFTLYLPIDGSARDAAPAISAPSEASGPGAVAQAPEESAAALFGSPLPDDHAALQAGERSILIIEDDAKFAAILIDFVRTHHFAALAAADGESGLALAKRYLPSAIILDVMLPHIDGWEVMRRLKADPQTRHIPVHFMTCLDDRKKALDMGAIGFISKPVSIAQLEEVLQGIEKSLAKSIKRLLIVEDDETEAQSLLALFSQGGIEVRIAQSGGQALDLLASKPFDCVVLDLGLSDMSGFALLQHMKERDPTSRVPIIIHSGRELTRDEENYLRRYTESIIIKGAKSPERLLNEVTLFLHLVERNLEPNRQKVLRSVLDKEEHLEGKKILLVDDDMRNIFSLSSLLSGKSMVVIEADNGKDALDKLEEHPDVQLILMDIMMPDMDGYAAMKVIRRDPRFAGLPIIAMTAKAMKEDQQKCLDAGASDYISKPIDVDKLLSLIRVWILRKA